MGLHRHIRHGRHSIAHKPTPLLPPEPSKLLAAALLPLPFRDQMHLATPIDQGSGHLHLVGQIKQTLMSDADWAKVNYVQQSGPTVSAKGRRLVLVAFFFVCACFLFLFFFLVMPPCSLCCSIWPWLRS